ncbi:MAG: methionyl-tRNA formyltransferase [Zoogloeaceae bacterium]|jgi:methionyl-tRNA formyltransferase|nr:methionyl-tRNA formyltransferase [Zoogloeaceae bacterium]
MRLIFAGTPDFAAASLAGLLAETSRYEVALVLTQPDRPAGRGMKCQASPVKRLAERHGLEVFQPHSLKENEEARLRLAASRAEIMIVAAYGLLLPPEILSLPRLGCLNIHASLLPRWRGAAPIQRAILAGDAQTGVCLMQMEEGLDSGPVLARAAVPILATDTSASLHDRLAELGARLLRDTLPRLPLTAVPQGEEGVMYARKMDKAEALLDWRRSAGELERQVRAFHPFPVARAVFSGVELKIWEARPVAAAFDAAEAPGTVLSADRAGILVRCGEGALLITQLQKPGGKRLDAADFLRGNTGLAAGVCL